MSSTPTTELSKLESAQHVVTALSQEQIFNVLGNLATPGAVAEFGAEYVLVVRTMALRRLESFGRGRRGLVSVPRLDRS